MESTLLKKLEDNNPNEIKIVVKTAEQFAKDTQKKAEISEAVGQLSKIKTFAIGPTGYASVISQGEKSMLKILEKESAKTYFEQILKDGTNEAKLYALYGLRKLNQKESTKYFEQFRSLSVEVQTMSGCEIGNEKFSDVVAQIEKMK